VTALTDRVRVVLLEQGANSGCTRVHSDTSILETRSAVADRPRLLTGGVSFDILADLSVGIGSETTR
jgi:hypothetical protein